MNALRNLLLVTILLAGATALAGEGLVESNAERSKDRALQRLPSIAQVTTGAALNLTRCIPVIAGLSSQDPAFGWSSGDLFSTIDKRKVVRFIQTYHGYEVIGSRLFMGFGKDGSGWALDDYDFRVFLIGQKKPVLAETQKLLDAANNYFKDNYVVGKVTGTPGFTNYWRYDEDAKEWKLTAISTHAFWVESTTGGQYPFRVWLNAVTASEIEESPEFTSCHGPGPEFKKPEKK